MVADDLFIPVNDEDPRGPTFPVLSCSWCTWSRFSVGSMPGGAIPARGPRGSHPVSRPRFRPLSLSTLESSRRDPRPDPHCLYHPPHLKTPGWAPNPLCRPKTPQLLWTLTPRSILRTPFGPYPGSDRTYGVWTSTPTPSPTPRNDPRPHPRDPLPGPPTPTRPRPRSST